jgi:hypothetical protein
MSKQDCSCRSACLDVPDPALSLSPLLAHPALPSPSIVLGPGTSTPDNLRRNAPKFPFSLLLQKLKRVPAHENTREIYAREIHAHETKAHQMHAREIYAYRSAGFSLGMKCQRLQMLNAHHA